MRIKATIEELKTYAKIHQDYMLQKNPDVALDFVEREIKFDPSNKEHMAATGSFNQFLAFKRQQSGVVADLSGLKLESLTLSECDLSGVILSGSTILGCVFSNSILRGVDLTQATVNENLFASATIDTARFEKAKISGNDFSSAKYTKDTFRGAEGERNLSKDNTGLIV